MDHQKHKKTAGFTLIEMMIVLAIIGILLGLATIGYDALKADARFSKIAGDMDGIAKSAANDYITNAVWAPLTFGAMPAVWASNRELDAWPSPPCPGWYYSWEDWSAFGYQVTQVTLRRADNTLLWGECLDSAGGTAVCNVGDPIFGGGGATDIAQVATHAVYCNE